MQNLQKIKNKILRYPYLFVQTICGLLALRSAGSSGTVVVQHFPSSDTSTYVLCWPKEEVNCFMFEERCCFFPFRIPAF